MGKTWVNASLQFGQTALAHGLGLWSRQVRRGHRLLKSVARFLAAVQLFHRLTPKAIGFGKQYLTITVSIGRLGLAPACRQTPLQDWYPYAKKRNKP